MQLRLNTSSRYGKQGEEIYCDAARGNFLISRGVADVIDLHAEEPKPKPQRKRKEQSYEQVDEGDDSRRRRSDDGTG